jgi:hypothetical protein
MTTFNFEEEVRKKLRQQKQKEYGDYKTNFHILSLLWSVILKDKLKDDIKPHEVSLCMVMLKLMRITENYKTDSYRDASIYLDMAQEIHKNDIDKKE